MHRAERSEDFCYGFSIRCLNPSQSKTTDVAGLGAGLGKLSQLQYLKMDFIDTQLPYMLRKIWTSRDEFVRALQ